MKRINILIITFLTSSGCAHYSGTFAPPPIWGYYGIQCAPERKVACIVSDGFDVAACDRIVKPAIKAVNEGAGVKLFRFQGRLQAGDSNGIAQAYKDGTYIVFENKDMAPEMYAFTVGRPSSFTDAQLCIEKVYTMLNPTVLGTPYEVPVMVHEMLHALGASHTVAGSPFGSIMTESVGAPNWRDHLTEFDVENLKRVYHD